MAFNLYVTLGGLCLLTDTGTELLVLLPPGTHGEEHFPVIGSHHRYQPHVAAPNCRNRMVEHPLKPGEVVLDPFVTPDPYTPPAFDAFNVVNVQAAAQKPPNPRKASIQMRIPNGTLATALEDSRPARWEWPLHAKPSLMATFVTWKVSGLTNTLEDGNEGIRVAFNGQKLTLRPQQEGRERRIGMYLFHVLEGERPCVNEWENRPMRRGEPAPHFSVFYDLFDEPANEHIPKFCNDGIREECDEPQVGLQPRVFSIGLRYTCIMAAAQA